MKKVVTVGVFDYFHYGHLLLFRHAREHGDYLIVAVQEDACIHKTKPDAVIFYSYDERTDMVGSCREVDEVVPYSDVDKLLPGLDFDVFAIGEDQLHAGFQRAVAWCHEHGKEVIRIPRTPGICASDIKKRVANEQQ